MPSPGQRLNRVLLPLLRRRPGRLLGHRLAVVEYQGRRTGRVYALVAQYAYEGSRLVITVGRPERKTWWRNFSTPHAMRLRLAGEEHAGLAHAERIGDAVRVVVQLDAPQRSLGTSARGGG